MRRDLVEGGVLCRAQIYGAVLPNLLQCAWYNSFLGPSHFYPCHLCSLPPSHCFSINKIQSILYLFVIRWPESAQENCPTNSVRCQWSSSPGTTSYQPEVFSWFLFSILSGPSLRELNTSFSAGMIKRNCTKKGWSDPFPPYHVACPVEDEIPLEEVSLIT